MDDIDLEEGGCFWLPIYVIIRLVWFIVVLPFKIVKFVVSQISRRRR